MVGSFAFHAFRVNAIVFVQGGDPMHGTKPSPVDMDSPLGADPEGSGAGENSPLGARARYLPSPREMEVIRELVKGRSSKQIATTLNISPHTVSAHRRNLLLRTGSDNTAQLVRHATEQGWA